MPRFMMLVKASADSEAGVMPTTEQFAEMGKYNEELVKAGVMLAGEGLQASSKGARIVFKGNNKTVVDGPFAETKELIAGFWIIQAKSLAEAVEWARRAPEPALRRRHEHRGPAGVLRRRLRRRADARAAREGEPAAREEQAQHGG